MSAYMLMTDSCADLSQAEVEASGVAVIPMHYTLDGVSYTNYPDHSELDTDLFFEKIGAGAACSTSAINVGDARQAMEPHLAAGRDVVYIAFSSALSSTYQSACIAAEELQEEYPGRRAVVIDSLSASRGQGRLVLSAAAEWQKGATLEELVDFIRAEIPHNVHWFTVSDLNQLKRGGRISATTALVGTMLQIKPVLCVNRKGQLQSVTKSRGVKAALGEMVNRMAETATEPVSEQQVLICHANCPEHVAYVKKLLEEKLGVTNVAAELIGPVIGSHTGVGTLGLFFRGSEKYSDGE